jgi:8-oxo-dGTP pyrophosphatase MutT (NUDIX family)
VAIEFNRFGDQVLAFVPGDQPIVPEYDADVPLTWAMVVVQDDDGRYLLFYNRMRCPWELPGGGIEPGELPDDAARREVQEETGQIGQQLRCQGVFKIYLRTADRYEYGALYTGTVGQLVPLSPNEESERIMLWQPGQALDGPLSALNQIMIDCLEHGGMP